MSGLSGIAHTNIDNCLKLYNSSFALWVGASPFAPVKHWLEATGSRLQPGRAEVLVENKRTSSDSVRVHLTARNTINEIEL